MAFTNLMVLATLLVLAQGYRFVQQPNYDVYEIEITQQPDDSAVRGLTTKASESVEASYRAAVEEVDESHVEAVRSSQETRTQLDCIAKEIQQEVCTINLPQIQQALYSARNPQAYQQCATSIVNNGLATSQALLDYAYNCVVEADQCRQQATDIATSQLQSVYNQGQQLIAYQCEVLTQCACNPYNNCQQLEDQLQCSVEELATAYNSLLTPLTAAEVEHQNQLAQCLAIGESAQVQIQQQILQQVQQCPC